MRRPLIAGNWKMNCAPEEARALARGVRRGLEASDRREQCDVLLCPPFLSLAAVKEEIEGSPIRLGAQNTFWETTGAFTGEISVPMLAEVGVSTVIVGHSERRELFGETDEWVARKIRAALAGHMVAIVCVGEKLEDREGGKTEQVIAGQFDRGLAEFGPQAWEKLVIAYEPVWAIGTGRTATPDMAAEVHRLIRDMIHHRVGDVSESVRILYGGSVKPENARDLMSKDDIDGALVGGASLSPDSFLGIVEKTVPDAC